MIFERLTIFGALKDPSRHEFRSWTSFILLSTLVFWLSNSSHADVTLAGGLVLTDSQIQQIKQGLSQTTEERFFYHWTTPEVGFRWALQGGLHQAEVDFYNKPTGSKQLYGPGVYLAESPTSSSHFGTFPVKFVIPRGTYIYDATVIRSVVGHDLNPEQIKDLGSRIPFIRKVSGDWWLAHHESALGRATYERPTNENQSTKDKRIEALTLPLVLRRIIRDALPNNPQRFSEMEDLLALSYYMDSSSLVRALLVSPHNPAQEFEPENFPRFKQTFNALVDNPDSILTTTLRKGPYFGSNAPTRSHWVAEMLRDLETIQSRISGETSGLRNEGVRAGGTGIDNRMLVTPTQYLTLHENPYLEVNAIRDPQLRGILVEYFYPDVFHYRKIRDRLSPELISEIERLSPEELMKAHETRRRLNERLIRELLNDAFLRLHGSPFDSDKLARLIVSIHPFQDMNGRAARLFSYIRVKEGDTLLRFPLESELDLLSSELTLSVETDRAERARRLWLENIAGVHLREANKDKRPDYGHPAISWMIYPFPVNFDNSTGEWDLTHDDLELIRQRNFAELTIRKRDHWSNIDNHDLDSLVKVAKQFGLDHQIAKLFQKVLSDLDTIQTHDFSHLSAEKVINLLADLESHKAAGAGQLHSIRSSIVRKAADTIEKFFLEDSSPKTALLNERMLRNAVEVLVAFGKEAEAPALAPTIEIAAEHLENSHATRLVSWAADQNLLPDSAIPELAAKIGHKDPSIDKLARSLLVDLAKQNRLGDSIIEQLEKKIASSPSGWSAMVAIEEIQKARGLPLPQSTIVQAAKDYFASSAAKGLMDRLYPTTVLPQPVLERLAAHVNSWNRFRSQESTQLLLAISKNQPLPDSVLQIIVETAYTHFDFQTRNTAWNGVGDLAMRNRLSDFSIEHVWRYHLKDGPVRRVLLFDIARHMPFPSSVIAGLVHHMSDGNRGEKEYAQKLLTFLAEKTQQPDELSRQLASKVGHSDPNVDKFARSLLEGLAKKKPPTALIIQNDATQTPTNCVNAMSTLADRAK